VGSLVGSGALLVNGAHDVLGGVLMGLAALTWLAHMLLDLRRGLASK
jgi:hypothetical protein